jgi:hypothetical protein
VLSERRNEVLKRLEVEALAHHELKSTPSRASLREAIAQGLRESLLTPFTLEHIHVLRRGLSRVHTHIYEHA